MKHLFTSVFALLIPALLNAQSLTEAIDTAKLEQPILIAKLYNPVPEEALVLPEVQEVKTAMFRESEFIKSKLYIAPAAMFGFGLLANASKGVQQINLKIRDRVLQQSERPISHKADDIMQYVPVYSVFALNAVGLKGQNKFIDRLFLYGISNTLMSHSVAKLKTVSKRLRPDGLDRRSFPSGHTATAFSAAEFMRMEYKDQSPIYGIAAYTVAAATGALRIYHNKHWFSDVVAGAGIGILSTDLTYFVYPKLKALIANKIRFKSDKLHVGPSYQSQSLGLAIVYNPK